MHQMIFRNKPGFTAMLAALILSSLTAFGQDYKDLSINVIKTFNSRVSGIASGREDEMFVSLAGPGLKKWILSINSRNETDTLCRLEGFAVQYLKAGQDGSVYASYVPERGKDNACLLKITGNKSRVLCEGFMQPVGMAFDTKQNICLVDAMLRKVYKITPGGSKSVFIDLDQYPPATGNLYHGLDYNQDNNVIFVAGINIEGGKGNILMFRIGQDGSVSGSPEVVCTGNCRQVITSGSRLYSTMNSAELIIKDFISGESEIITHPLLANGMALSFGGKGSGNKLYINTPDKIISLSFP